MKSLELGGNMNLLPLFLVFFASLVLAQNATQQAELAAALELIQTMPECARTCLLEGVAAAGITANNLDISASCSNETATTDITNCAMDACSIRDQLSAKNVTEALCSRQPHKALNYSPDSIIGFACAALAFLMRMASKIRFPCQRGARIDTDFSWDDGVITIVMVLLIPITVLSNILCSLGVGHDIWTIPFDKLTQLQKIYYVDEILYLTALPFVKVSILLTYLRIFQSKNFRIWVWTGIALNLAYWITFVFATALQCIPVHLAWTGWALKDLSPGHCSNVNGQAWAAAALNIVLDVFVVVLPMPMLWNMNLNIRKKMLVMMMFGVGFFATIVAILRLQILVNFGDSQNLTYDNKAAGRWTIIELDTAICCACMPGIRNLLRRAFPKLMGDTSKGRSGAMTPGQSALSGRTAITSDNDKHSSQMFVRPRHSDDSNFIPLQEVSVEDMPTHQKEHRWKDAEI